MGVGSVRGCPLIHKVVNRIYAYMLPQMAQPVRHPPQPTHFLNNSPQNQEHKSVDI